MCCIERLQAAQQGLEEGPLCPSCYSADTFLRPKPVQAKPLTLQAKYEALATKVADLWKKAQEQQHLVNQVKNMTLEKEEEECYLIWNCDYLCAHALGSTSGEASLKVPKCMCR
ncbi:hypothetical protein FRC12_011089 [Ceratobasidium sp. 428]|nr:hypothetical protein FRC12_011089 [Ceratobasidium sp. 428]